MVAWAAKHVVPETAVLDVGCGNGHLLFGLADEGFTKLHGVDYSEPAIELCRRLAEENERSDIEFSVLDLCTPDALPEDLLGKYGLIMDKGTFDAITLATGSPKPTDLYKDSVARLLKPDGLLLVTSCNWTQDELVKEFERSGWKYHAHVKYPTFRFGGVQGQTVWCVAFERAGVFGQPTYLPSSTAPLHSNSLCLLNNSCSRGAFE